MRARPRAPPSRETRRRADVRTSGERGSGRGRAAPGDAASPRLGGKRETPHGAYGSTSGEPLVSAPRAPRRSRVRRPVLVWRSGRAERGEAHAGCGVPCSCGAPAELNAGKRTRGVDGVQGVARGFMPGRVGVGVKGTATASWWASRTSSSSRGVSSVPGSSRICTSMAAASLDPRALGSGRGVRCAPRCIAANRPRDGPRGAPRPSEAFPERAELSSLVVGVNFRRGRGRRQRGVLSSALNVGTH